MQGNAVSFKDKLEIGSIFGWQERPVIVFVCNEAQQEKTGVCVCVWLGDRDVSTKVGGRVEVTHASQGCDMPGSRQRSRCPENTHSFSFSPWCVCVKVCQGVTVPSEETGSKRQTQPLLLPAGVARENKDWAESRSQAGPNGSVMLWLQLSPSG